MADKKKKGKVSGAFKAVGADIKDIGTTFAKGDWKTRVSFLIMGFGQLTRKQWVRGIAFLGSEVLFILYMVFFGAGYLKDIGTLGTKVGGYDANYVYTYGDNSFLILLYSILSIFVILAFIFVWRLNIRDNMNNQNRLILPSNKDDIAALFDEHFDKTLLALPVIGVFMFVLLPIIFMICIAFTNYDATHQSPTNLFTWVGLTNFKNLLSIGTGGFGKTFGTVLSWTLIWAFFATFTNYIFGMILAIMINRKDTKAKGFWRFCFVLSCAVPMFVSLLIMRTMLQPEGAVNVLLRNLGWIAQDASLPFFTDPTWARVTVIVVNIWVGVPYTLLQLTGVLQNIPADLYEAARVDGANSIQIFFKITLPYMLYVTTPYLIATFTGNVNNFNIIYLLSGGDPITDLSSTAGSTDLLVTWLYKLTVDKQYYNIGAVIGSLTFIILAVGALFTYRRSKSYKEEGGF